LHNRIEIVRELIRAGAALDVQDQYNQRTALHYATMTGFIDNVQELIRAGAALGVKGCDGETALQWIQAEDYDDIAALLEEAEEAADLTLV
jgi:ankyrin repeat protein